ncbi:hypothetical protein FOPG_05487 [Fusarium oxysporum f. sp. conglutinans race 2 54008]|uniref:Uncharacterized protein n=1 Tax=Fusarium oxysporum f. sp. conglutinans race 2 54008 TaxID=1089457 RepID=X0J7I1_FUSOX|nr:hypothetical protein FOPG_05487 [Fusarium oxysporum f. sp. conglutinans race 2 54008]
MGCCPTEAGQFACAAQCSHHKSNVNVGNQRFHRRSGPNQALGERELTKSYDSPAIDSGTIRADSCAQSDSVCDESFGRYQNSRRRPTQLSWIRSPHGLLREGRYECREGEG